MRKFLLLFMFFIQVNLLFSQFSYPTPYFFDHEISADFLEFCTDPAAGALGEALTAASPFYPWAGLLQNPALLAANASIASVNVTYSPWLRLLMPPLNLTDLNAVYPISQGKTLGYRFRYYNMNENMFLIPGSVNEHGGREFLHQLSWGQKLNENFSGGISFKYFHSNLTQYASSAGYDINSFGSFALDLGVVYGKKYSLNEKTELNLQIASSIRNFGPRIQYSKDPGEMKKFLPTVLGVGILMNRSRQLNNPYKMDWDLVYQADKFLVPSDPVYDHEGQIITGKNPDISPFRALYQSFYDAPLGFSEEIREIVHKGGLEIRFSNSNQNYFALRAGKIWGNPTKFNLDYSSLGGGMGIKGLSIDFKFITARYPHPIETWTLMLSYRSILKGKE
jgi:hypothetical protein